MRQKVSVCRSQVNKIVMQAQVPIYELLSIIPTQETTQSAIRKAISRSEERLTQKGTSEKSKKIRLVNAWKNTTD